MAMAVNCQRGGILDTTSPEGYKQRNAEGDTCTVR